MAPQDWQQDNRRQQSPRPQSAAGYHTPPNGNMPTHGTGQVQAMPQGRLGSSPQVRAETNPGRHPLDDAQWGQNAPPAAQQQVVPSGAGTRVQSLSEQDYVIKSNKKGWIILVILMLAGLGAGALIAWQSS
jgi:hypothetical protein